MTHPLLPFLKHIPTWRVTTYKALGLHFWLHPRTVASILSKNTQTDVFPCYKVIHENGAIEGYNQGIHEKQRRLQNDKIPVIDGKIPDDCIMRGFDSII